MSYPAISLATATVGAIGAPKNACRPPANLPSTRIRARIIAPVTPSPLPLSSRRPSLSIGGFGLKRRLVIEDARGETVAEVSGSVFRRYTFMVNRRGEEIGRITKQWSGVGREMFTDADTFLVELPVKHGDDLQYLVFATAFCG